MTNPITLGGLFKSEWEEIMAVIDKSSHPEAYIVKYKLQCRIEAAILRDEWK